MLKGLRCGKKGDAEIISYVIITFIVIVIIMLITTELIPTIEENQSKQRFEQSKQYIDKIDSEITKLAQEPTGSSSQLAINLNRLYLNIDADNNKIEIYHIMTGNYYDNNLKIKDGTKYTYRNFQKLYAGVEYDEIDITQDLSAENRFVYLYLTKTDKNKIKIELTAGQ